MTQQVSKALALGAVVGFVLAAFPACGPRTTISRCNASNCDGCCDDTGSCFKGISTEACGAAGASCQVCSAGQTCDKLDPLKDFGGKCTMPNTGGGDGGTGGGTGGGAGGGTGGGTGGGSGGGTGGGAGTCNATNCANGCCTSSGTCITALTPSRCGTGGALCAPCTMGNTCVSGACTPCAGCVNPQTGACETSFNNTLCPQNGAGSFCTACDSTAGQTCRIVAPATIEACHGGTTCNSSTCAGCCDGNNCITPSSYTNAQCGTGINGQACVTCSAGAVCDAMDAGTCTGGAGGGTGGGGGLPGLDGGIGFICNSTTPCGSGQCCDSLAGAFGICVNNGEACAFSPIPFIGGTCNGSAGVCQ